MADPAPTPSTSDGTETILAALTDLLRSGISPDVVAAQRLLLRRLALEGDVLPSRVPAPRNITEVGGYFNLLTTINQLPTRDQMLAAALGVGGPNAVAVLDEVGPPVSYVELANDRPPGPAQPSIPVGLWVRSDFAPSLSAALAAIRGDGCALPLLAVAPHLPGNGTAVAGDALLRLLGRQLDLIPATMLVDPATDPLAVATRADDPSGATQLAARELDGAGKVAEADWTALACTADACAMGTAAPARLRAVMPDLNAAGWYLADSATPPSSATKLGGFRALRNLTGLVAGSSTLGDELARTFSAAAIAGSPYGDRLGWRWDGKDFAAAS